MKSLKLGALLTSLAAPALAHPGHGADPATHWVADLPHLAVTLGLVALGAVALGGLLSRRRARSRKDRT